MRLDLTNFRNLDWANQHEWLVTNGLGGYASSTITGANTRRYHALLLVSLLPPVDRVVLVSKVEDEIEIGGALVPLSTNYYPGVVHPDGWRYLESFRLDPLPTYRYRLPGGRLERTVFMPQGQQATLIAYRWHARQPALLRLRPLVTFRDYHSQSRRGEVSFSERPGAGRVLLSAPGLPKPLVVEMAGAAYHPDPRWHERLEYPRELERGLEHREDLFSPGFLEIALEPGQPCYLVCSLGGCLGHPAALESAEAARLRGLAAAGTPYGWLPGRLFPAAHSFLVRRDERAPSGRARPAGMSLVAGYHWFADWGRDTMIALPGVCLVTGCFAAARQVLATFAANLRSGLVPNRFSDTGAGVDYNSVDASLWFVYAAWKYYRYTRDGGTLELLRPALAEVLAAYRDGTDYGIGMDRDGLVRSGAPGLQLTWMDAKIGDWVVTPRQGKAVEISALWYNALCAYADLAQALGWEAAGWRELAARARQGFSRFWNPRAGCLYDVIDGPYGPDDAIRPNQVLATSLPFPVLTGERAASVLAVVRKQLLTPFGLRTLAPGHPDYQGQCTGDQRARDSAYHQGTVWAWLLGPYLDAVARLEGGGRRLDRLLSGVKRHLREAGLGSISEIFDGDPPHHPRGCISQAWSVAEVLRACVEHGPGREEDEAVIGDPAVAPVGARR